MKIISKLSVSARIDWVLGLVGLAFLVIAATVHDIGLGVVGAALLLILMGRNQ